MDTLCEYELVRKGAPPLAFILLCEVVFGACGTSILNSVPLETVHMSWSLYLLRNLTRLRKAPKFN